MTKKRKLPSPRVLRRLLDYNPETGELRWKERPVWMFANTHLGGRFASRKQWNTRYANRPAFTSVNDAGYFYGRVFKSGHRAHRIIWALHYGEHPVGEIDHINGDRKDNRISNLRDVSRKENRRNTRRLDSNTSGRTGVSWSKSNSKWHAYIGSRNTRQNLGWFESFDDAVSARRRAERRHNYHLNHGR